MRLDGDEWNISVWAVLVIIIALAFAVLAVAGR